MYPIMKKQYSNHSFHLDECSCPFLYIGRQHPDIDLELSLYGIELSKMYTYLVCRMFQLQSYLIVLPK